MATKIFVNLPVHNLDQSIRFFTSIGYSFNKQFSDDTAACMVVSEDIYTMLLTIPKFKEFTKKDICDKEKAIEVILALSSDSKEEVDSIITKAIEAGGKEPRPIMDLGFMYTRCFEDPDGHLWEVFWMDPLAVQ